MHGCTRVVVGSLFGAILAACGCDGPLPPQAKQLLSSSSEAFDKKDYTGAIRHADAFLKDYPKGRGTDEAYFTRGLAKYRLNDRAGAKADLAEALDRTNLDHIRVHASNALGDLAWDDDDLKLAEKYYRQTLESTGKADPAEAHARYRLGCVLQRRSAWEDADSQFDRVIHVFGDSHLAKLAARRARSRAWTIQAGAYEKRAHADVAAQQFLKSHLPAKVQDVIEDGKLLFLVQVGRYGTYEAAVSQLAEVLTIKSDAHVTVTR